jgi:hypothetical protein
VSITVIPDPAFSPPRMRIDLQSQGTMPVPADGLLTLDQAQAVAQADGYTLTPTADPLLYTVSGTPGDYLAVPGTVPTSMIFNSLSLYRVQAGQRTLVRSQPGSGGSVAFAYDYEAPYGVPVTYEADETLVQSGPVTEWAETWSDLSEWTIAQGDASVSGGELTLIGTLGDSGVVTRGLAGSGGYRITAADVQPGGGSILARWGSSYGTAGVAIEDATHVTVFCESSTKQYVIPAADSYQVEIDVVGLLVSFTINGTTWTMNRADNVNPYRVEITGPGSTALFGGAVAAAAFTASTAATKVTEVSVPETLAPASGWLVHPLVPALSVPVSTTDRTLIGVQDIGDVTQASTATVHKILGQAAPIVSRSGPRLGDALTLTLALRNPAQKAQLAALLADQTPVLIRMLDPDLDWEDGFYSVGDLGLSRFAQNTQVKRRTATLPLQATQSPAGTIQNPGWSYAAVAIAYSSYNAVAEAYATYADLAANNTRS